MMGFRGYPGLYDQLDDVIPRCARHGFDDIVMNTCITAETCRRSTDAPTRRRPGA